MNLSTPVEKVDRIGPKYAKKLQKLDIKEVKDLLFHFPSRYEDFSHIVPIKNLKKDQQVTIRGKVLSVDERSAQHKRLKIIEVVAEDATGVISAIWFNQRYVANQLAPGNAVFISGKVSVGKDGMYISNPVYEFDKMEAAPIHTARVVPIYPETRGVTSRLIRYAVSRTLPFFEDIEESLPESLRKEKDMPGIFQALRDIHFPSTIEDAERARRRFEFEEVLSIQLAAMRAKQEIQEETAPKVPTKVNLTKNFVKSLPFTLTDSQKKASWQILKDMEKRTPMNRLLEGDVGSGKTVVAAVAVLNAIENNFQVAFMAPTEVLAEQHFKTLKDLLKSQNIEIALYTRSHRKVAYSDDNGNWEENSKSKQKLKEELENGNIRFVVGTHTLAQEDVYLDNPGLIIIDEQHRFGVQQRASLVKKQEGKQKTEKKIPHLLSMTATPIPRSLALTVYGDLDLTLLREMPKGRKRIITKIIPPEKRNDAFSFIRKELDKGRQAFCIFPLIENSNALALRSATQEYEKLSQGPLKKYNIALLHGRMKAKEKERIMKDMQEGKIQALISTSVVEVGIDVPNATIMMIDGADRFGLAQLHQFRGRVGRSDYQSYAFLLTESESEQTLRRLRALTKSKNGFELAEYDLSFRGAGDLYGVRQSGMPDMAMASLSNVQLIEEGRESAIDLLKKDPELKNTPALKAKVEDIQKKMHFE